MSENDAWNGPVSDSHADLIDAKATKKRSDGDGTDSVGPIETGAIGVTKSTPKKKSAKKTEPAKKYEATVALHSTRNVVWEGVGKIAKGYNIVSAAHAEKWLTRSHVREATPEEIAREYGN
jgi:hypothetical protein